MLGLCKPFQGGRYLLKQPKKRSIFTEFIMKIIENLMKASLYECCSQQSTKAILDSPAYLNAVILATEDLKAFLKKDPSASSDYLVLAQTSTSFSAVLHYRLAHSIYFKKNELLHHERENNARLISQRGKLKSGAEIHFKSRIGRNFVLDHGYGTVIGETTIIGEDCYILGGVILGAKGISLNPSESRHPIIGNNVQIGSFSSVFGKINIGDNVFIGANLCITNDIPPCAIITLQNQL